MITITSLSHPTMIKKIRMALQYALLGQGHKMNGHGNRCYIQNAQGRNIMRLDWIGGKAGYIVYGSASKDAYPRNITTIVNQALHRDIRLAADTLIGFERPSPEAIALVQGNPDLKARLAKLATLAGMGAMLTACSNHGGVMSLTTIIGSLFT